MREHSDINVIEGSRCALLLSLLPLCPRCFWPVVERIHATEPKVALRQELRRVLSLARWAGPSVWALAPLSEQARAQPRAQPPRRTRSTWVSLFGITRRQTFLANTLRRRAGMQLHHATTMAIVLCVTTTSCRPGRRRGPTQSLQLQLRPMRRCRPRQVLTRPNRTLATRQPCYLR